jgi:hypothetical protein
MTVTVSRRPADLAWVAAVFAVLSPMSAHADFHVRSPSVVEGEVEVEHNGAYTNDSDPTKGNATSFTAELGWGATSWWKTEFELPIGRDAGLGESTKIQGVTWENTFQLTEPGEYWANLGFYWEYAAAFRGSGSDTTEFGPLIQKDVGKTTHTLNLFLSKGVGANQDMHGFDFNYAWQSRWNVIREISPAFEIYGDPGPVDHFAKFQNQQLIAGPVVLGSFLLGNLGNLGNLHYEIGYLFGATSASSNGTVRWQLEWETHF